MPFTAYVPIETTEQVSLTPTEAVADGRRVFRLARFQGVYGLYSPLFDREADAEAAIEDLRAAVLWFALTNSTGVRCLTVRGEVVGDIQDVREIAVLNDDRPLRGTLEGFAANMVRGFSEQAVRGTFGEALSFPRLRVAFEDPKLRLAIELYVAHWFEASANMRLITLVASLESITPQARADEGTVRAAEIALQLLARRRDQADRGSEDYRLLADFCGKLGLMKRASIGESLRAHVSSVVAAHPELGDREDLSERVARAYDARSRLLHVGHADDIPEALAFLQDFLPRFLSVLFRQAATAR